MIKIIVDNGECTLSWGGGSLFDIAEEAADGACVAIEEIAYKAHKAEGGEGTGIEERELFYQVFVDRVHQNRVTGAIGEDYAENDD